MRLTQEISQDIIKKDYKSSISRKKGYFSVISKGYIRIEKNSNLVFGDD